MGREIRLLEEDDGWWSAIDEDPLAALRDEFDDVDKSAAELRENGREEALDEAGS